MVVLSSREFSRSFRGVALMTTVAFTSLLISPTAEAARYLAENPDGGPVYAAKRMQAAQKARVQPQASCGETGVETGVRRTKSGSD